MAEEKRVVEKLALREFDGGPFALDLYRLLAIVLGDQRIARLGDETRYHQPPVWQLQDQFRNQRRGDPHSDLVGSGPAYFVRPAPDGVPKDAYATVWFAVAELAKKHAQTRGAHAARSLQ